MSNIKKRIFYDHDEVMAFLDDEDNNWISVYKYTLVDSLFPIFEVKYYGEEEEV